MGAWSAGFRGYFCTLGLRCGVAVQGAVCGLSGRRLEAQGLVHKLKVFLSEIAVKREISVDTARFRVQGWSSWVYVAKSHKADREARRISGRRTLNKTAYIMTNTPVLGQTVPL